MSAPQANPFPAGSKVNYPDLWADRRETYASLKKAFDIAFRSSEPMVIQVKGDYGLGKTHSLKHIEYAIHENLWGKARGHAIYVENPGVDQLDFFNRFLSSTKMETLISSLREILAQIMLAKSARLQKELLEGKTAPQDIVTGLESPSLRLDLKQRLLETFKGIGFSIRDTSLSDYWDNLSTALSMMPFGGADQFAAGKWFTFQRLYKNDRDVLGIQDNTPSPSYVAACFVAVVRLIAQANNYQKIVILVDEVEDLVGAPGLELLAQCLRQIIDSGLPELVIVLGTSLAADQVFTDIQALQRRIHMTINLLPLSPKEARQFVADYLQRSPKGKGEDSITPFTDEAVTLFTNSVAGRVNQLLPVLNRAYDMYLRESWRKIGPEEAKKTMSEVMKLGIITPLEDQRPTSTVTEAADPVG